jgi:ribosomal protein S27E
VGLIKWIKDYNEGQKRIEARRMKRVKEAIDNDELPDVDEVHCPKCGSTQITAGNKGFSVGKAVIGDIVAGPVGLVAGAIGSKKTMITCLKCGHKWQAGKK